MHDSTLPPLFTAIGFVKGSVRFATLAAHRLSVTADFAAAMHFDSEEAAAIAACLLSVKFGVVECRACPLEEAQHARI